MVNPIETTLTQAITDAVTTAPTTRPAGGAAAPLVEGAARQYGSRLKEGRALT